MNEKKQNKAAKRNAMQRVEELERSMQAREAAVEQRV